MRVYFIIWLVGYVIAAALIFIGSAKNSDDVGERLIGALLLGVLSWVYVAIVVIYHLVKPREKK